MRSGWMVGKTSFFNYGMADNAQNRPVTADSIFNLGSVEKVFATTLLAQGVKQGELSLDDSVAKYVTKLQRDGDIRRITLGQLASHTSGLPRVPQQYETWHKGRYTWLDFVRFLNSWKADPKHEPGQQYLYFNAAMALLRVALERRFITRFAALMHERLTGPVGDDVDRTSFAARFAWSRRARLRSHGQTNRAAGYGSGKLSNCLAPAKSIRRSATWPPFWLRISVSFPIMVQSRMQCPSLSSPYSLLTRTLSRASPGRTSAQAT